MPVIMSLFFFIGMFFSPLPSGGADLSLSDLISRMQKSYEGLNDLSASFEQETVLQDFKTPIRSRGELYLKKKDKMKLVYAQPKKEEIVINGNQMITYLPGRHQAIKGVFSKAQETRLPVRLLSGEAVLSREFKILQDPDAGVSSYRLNLIPVQKDENLEKVKIELDPATYLIKNLQLVQSNGNVSSFAFSRIHPNNGLKDSVFIFTAPEGTDIIQPFIPSPLK